jgi:tetraacyldisaccharide 4'-kinase
VRIFLAPFGLIYGLVNRLRRYLYDIGFFRSQRLLKPVISVGNLTVGGTGKTPFVDVLLTQFENRGLKCGVLTRGYARNSTDTLLVSAQTTASEVGDEPQWLFGRHPQAKIAVGADRLNAAKLAPDVDVYILDDGLQHLQIHRDFEITLIDATRPLSHYHPLPWGLARERFDVLRRSDLVILSRSNLANAEQLDLIADVIFKNGVLDLVEASFDPSGVSDVLTEEPKNISALKVGLVSAIGNPESFEQLIKNSGGNVAFHEKKADHRNYSMSDITRLEKKAATQSVGALLVTEKDAVKIRKLLQARGAVPLIPWLVASVKLNFDPELPNIYDLVSYSSP